MNFTVFSTLLRASLTTRNTLVTMLRYCTFNDKIYEFITKINDAFGPVIDSKLYPMQTTIITLRY